MRPLVASITAKISDNSTSVHTVLHAGTQQVLFGSVGYFAPALLRILVFITKNISVTN